MLRESVVPDFGAINRLALCSFMDKFAKGEFKLE